MTVETDFRGLLAAHAPLTALVQSRIALNAAPQGVDVPIVVFAVRAESLLDIAGVKLSERCSIDVQCWARSAAEASAVAEAVAAAVATAPSARGAVVSQRATVSDEETGLDGEQLVVDWWD